ncbi:hypothetical protein [Arundinibacter roseus]|uniref:Curlin n=1 Tax=Arundinibacter roseus TaxID=2070510 RepID=A0A4V2X9N3_9BACT|nr:hypothetical protein [Arundinibacter roseus]TDB64055.1 hypothetical protein EZE20_14020 [Arundinibacter roseus]
MKKLTCILILMFGLGRAYAQQNGTDLSLQLLPQSQQQMRQVAATASSVRVEDMMGLQLGNGNVQRVTANGQDNQLRMAQDGDFNTMNMQLSGNGNAYEFVQQGNRNLLDVRGVQSSNSTLQIIQRGNGNQLVDEGSGMLNRSIRIEQSGGMKVFINGKQ